jgi:endonuclease/exonuclease/phosphatase family metal-dependent hydrolase
VVTINLWNDASGCERRMEVLLPQLVALEPHLVALQEVREVKGGLRQAAQIADAIDADFRFAPSDPRSLGGPIGNAVVSRLPILTEEVMWLPSETGDPRNVLRCTIETPRGQMVIVTTHLTWQLAAAAAREQQAIALDAFAKRDPGEIPTVLCGDFNCTPDSEVHRFLTGRVSLAGKSTYWRDAYQRRHPHSDGFTWSARNPYVARNVERNRRIDFIFVGELVENGPGAIQHARVVLDLPGADRVFPSDHFGVFAEISLIPIEAAW